MKITEWMNDVNVDEEIVDKIEFQSGCNLSKKGIKKSVFQKIGRENSNPVYVYGRRAIIATAACAVIVSAIFVWNAIGNFGKQTKTAGTPANSFTIYAEAAELKSSVPVLFDNIGAGALSGDEYGNVGYNVDLPLYCKGDNIKSITYKINQGAFMLADCPAAKSLISKKALPSDSIFLTSEDWSTGYFGSGDVLCTEFTIDYKKQVKPGGVIRFIHMIGEKNVEHADGVASTDTKEQKLMLDELYKGLVIKCTVNFKDGSKQSKKIHVENKIMTWKEAYPGKEVAFPNRKDAFSTLVCD